MNRNQNGSAVLIVAMMLSVAIAAVVMTSDQLFISKAKVSKLTKNQYEAKGNVSMALQIVSTLYANGRLKIAAPNTVTLFDGTVLSNSIGGDFVVKSPAALANNIITIKTPDLDCLRGGGSRSSCRAPVQIRFINVTNAGDLAQSNVYANVETTVTKPTLMKQKARILLGKSPDQCVQETGVNNYNIVLVFDHSGSQASTDPGNVRKKGALRFIELFKDVAKRNPALTINVSVVRFSTNAQQGPNGWIQLSDVRDSLLEPGISNKISDDISFATDSPSGRTNYQAALSQAKALMSSRPSGAKNYVVFLTDGLPNVPDTFASSYMPLVNELSTTHSAAFYTIASGTGVSLSGEEVVRAMALPISGSHRGLYQRARYESELERTWDNVFSAITSCTPNTVFGSINCKDLHQNVPTYDACDPDIDTSSVPDLDP